MVLNPPVCVPFNVTELPLHISWSGPASAKISVQTHSTSVRSVPEITQDCPQAFGLIGLLAGSVIICTSMTLAAPGTSIRSSPMISKQHSPSDKSGPKIVSSSVTPPTLDVALIVIYRPSLVTSEMGTTTWMSLGPEAILIGTEKVKILQKLPASTILLT